MRIDKPYLLVAILILLIQSSLNNQFLILPQPAIVILKHSQVVQHPKTRLCYSTNNLCREKRRDASVREPNVSNYIASASQEVNIVDQTVIVQIAKTISTMKSKERRLSLIYWTEIQTLLERKSLKTKQKLRQFRETKQFKLHKTKSCGQHLLKRPLPQIQLHNKHKIK